MTSKVFAVIVSAFTVPIFVSILFLPAFVFAEAPPASEPPAFLKDIKSEADINTLSPEQKKQFEEFLKNDSSPSLIAPSVVAPEGSVACFDYYHFGSVQVDLSSTLATTVPGATIGFTGTVKNANTYPLVDGQVYVKIFRKGGDESLIHQNGYALVDQFALPDTFTLPAKGEKEASFTWKVPENAPTGDYMAAFFFETAKRYNLLGLSFTDDVTGNQAQFSVKNSTDTGVVAFDKNSVTKNGEPHRFAAFLTQFTKDEPVTITTKLVNPKNESVVVPVTWKLYAWDSLREETLKDTKTELVELKPKETKTLSYTATPIDASASYLVVETKDGNSKSILDIRFARSGIEETRINFPSITSFPLEKGVETTLFSCVHSTNLPVVKDNLLTLTLKDDQGKIIHSYKYQGDITGAMMGVKDSFTPDQTYDNFTLTATLARQGKVVEEVTQKYACQDIDPSLCSKAPGAATEAESGLGRGAVMAIVAALAILLLVLARTLWRGRGAPRGQGGGPRSTHTRTLSFLFAFFLSGTFLFGGVSGAQAKSVSWNTTYGGTLDYYWNNNGGAGGETSGWAPALSNPNVTISYAADVYNADTSALIADGSAIPVGTKLQFTPKSFADTDISWFGTGYTSDSPYGDWVVGAVYPPGGSCQDKNKVAESPSWLIIFKWKVYIPLSIAPPIKTFAHSGTAGLSCNGVGDLCTVTSPGTIVSTVAFQSTQGKFYYDYVWQGSGCVSNFYALRASGASSDYILPVPTQTIIFNFTAVAGNTPPNIPILTPLSPTGTPGSLVAITALSTDPDTGDTIHYGFDWDNNGLIEWAPIFGYVASGTPQTLSHSWSTAGTYPIKVLAQDSNGNSSGWASTSITISSATNGVCGVADTATSGVTFASAPTLGLCQDGALPPVSGSGPWTWTCLGSSGGTNASCQADPTGSLPQLEVCLNDGGLIPVAAGNGDSYTVPQMSIGNTKTFQTFYDPVPGDCGGSAPVTGGTTWDASSGSAVSFTSAGVLYADANGSETVSVSYNGQTITMNATVAPPACIVDCSNAANTCQGQPFNDANGCGTNNCTGTRYCDFNWKEVAP